MLITACSPELKQCQCSATHVAQWQVDEYERDSQKDSYLSFETIWCRCQEYVPFRTSQFVLI